MSVQKFDAEDVRQFLRESSFNETNDVDLSEARRIFQRKLIDTISDTIDDMFGPDVADAHTELSDLHNIAELLATQFVHHPSWKKIVERIRRRESLM